MLSSSIAPVSAVASPRDPFAFNGTGDLVADEVVSSLHAPQPSPQLLPRRPALPSPSPPSPSALVATCGLTNRLKIHSRSWLTSSNTELTTAAELSLVTDESDAPPPSKRAKPSISPPVGDPSLAVVTDIAASSETTALDDSNPAVAGALSDSAELDDTSLSDLGVAAFHTMGGAADSGAAESTSKTDTTELGDTSMEDSVATSSTSSTNMTTESSAAESVTVPAEISAIPDATKQADTSMVDPVIFSCTDSTLNTSTAESKPKPNNSDTLRSPSLPSAVASRGSEIRESREQILANKHAWDAMLVTGSAKRIKKELDEINLIPIPNCSAGPKAGSLFEWEAIIIGPAETPYAGGVFSLDIVFPANYPFKAPAIVFRTRIWHCNVNSSGAICLDMCVENCAECAVFQTSATHRVFIPAFSWLSVCRSLRDNWSPGLTISKVLLSLLSLLASPNPDDPLVKSIALLLLRDPVEHDRIAAEWTRQFAL